MKDISIIIPCYKAHKTIRKTLHSIFTQSIIDKLHVVVVVDADGENYDYLKESFDIDIIYLKENVGPGGARQAGIDATKEPYMMFIDADDLLASPYAVMFLYNHYLKPESKDIVLIGGTFYEELPDGFVKHENDLIWMHGKLYRRSFWDKHEIRFNGTRANEDLYINRIFQMLENDNERIAFTTDVVYYWQFLKDSIVRRDNFHYTYNDAFTSMCYNIAEAIKFSKKHKGNAQTIKFLSVKTMIDAYFMYLGILKNGDDKAKKNALISSKKYYKTIYSKLDEKDIRMIEPTVYSGQLDALKDQLKGLYIENPTYHEFLKLME